MCGSSASIGTQKNSLRLLHAGQKGWTGDLVALARAFRRNDGPRRDDALAARLLELAAARNHPQAQWELSIMARQGAGIPRDPARALSLARAVAASGDAAGANVYGVTIRDGIARARDDGEAAIWFRRAADLRNSCGMTNLASLMWDGRGGLPRDRSAAAALWRRAIYQDENPWAQLFLAEALASGEGVARSTAEAVALYQAAANQDREPGSKAPGQRGAGAAAARIEDGARTGT